MSPRERLRMSDPIEIQLVDRALTRAEELRHHELDYIAGQIGNEIARRMAG